jgi:methylthioribose-1-phosphate isomerase
VNNLPRAVAWVDGALRLLDQTRLPHTEAYLDCHNIESVYEAIATMRVRGAPAIGIAGAYGMLLPFRDTHEPGTDNITVRTVRDIHVSVENDRGQAEVSLIELERRADYLVGARPTAVNLSWAVNRMLAHARELPNVDVPKLLEEARRIHAEDAAACRAIGEAGAPFVKAHPRLLTHCNAGSLAVSEFGTALAPIYVAHSQGNRIHVFVDETRPLLQGSRLTAWELQRAGVDLTVIADNMAAHLMSTGRIDAVIVGADRVAANGDVANKIGTLNLAILCKHFGLPFYVACPWSTIDPATATGSEISIEKRSSEELTHIMGVPISPPDIDVFNPAFDVTPAELVSSIITERGVVTPPYPPQLTCGQ